MKHALAGIDIGGTKIAIALSSLEGEIIAEHQFPNRSEAGPYAALERVSRSLTEMERETGAKILSIGVGSPAPLDVENGLVMSPSNLRGWVRFPVTKLLGESFGVPVMLDNDANAAALGEYIYGAGRGCKNIFYITVSTGIGGGIIVGGELMHGVSTGAGEIGHTIVQPDGVRCNCGSTGCLETICSGTHIVRRVTERLTRGDSSIINKLVSGGEEISAKMVIGAVQSGDRLAIEIWNETCRYLALGIANAITLLAPEIVIVGGGIASAGELLFEPLRKMVPQFVSMIPAEKIKIAPAALGTQSGLYGALVLAQKAHNLSLATYAA